MKNLVHDSLQPLWIPTSAVWRAWAKRSYGFFQRQGTLNQANCAGLNQWCLRTWVSTGSHLGAS